MDITKNIIFQLDAPTGTLEDKKQWKNIITSVNENIIGNSFVGDNAVDLQGFFNADVDVEIFNDDDYIKIYDTTQNPNDDTSGHKYLLKNFDGTGWIRDVDNMCVIIEKIIIRYMEDINKPIIPSDVRPNINGVRVQQHLKVSLTFELDQDYEDGYKIINDIKVSNNLKYALGGLNLDQEAHGGTYSKIFQIFSSKIYYPLQCKHIYITVPQLDPTNYDGFKQREDDKKIKERDPRYRLLLSTDFSFSPSSRVQIPTNRVVLQKCHKYFNFEFYNENWEPIINPFRNILVELTVLQNQKQLEERQRREKKAAEIFAEENRKREEAFQKRMSFEHERLRLLKTNSNIRTILHYQNLQKQYDKAVMTGDFDKAEELQQKMEELVYLSNTTLDGALTKIAEHEKTTKQEILRILEKEATKIKLEERRKLYKQGGRTEKQINQYLKQVWDANYSKIETSKEDQKRYVKISKEDFKYLGQAMENVYKLILSPNDIEQITKLDENDVRNPFDDTTTNLSLFENDLDKGQMGTITGTQDTDAPTSVLGPDFDDASIIHQEPEEEQQEQ